MRPVRGFVCVSVLHGIEMYVIDVESQIFIVADGVLPETTLPDAAFAL